MTEELYIYVDASRGDQCSGLGYVMKGEVNDRGRKTLYGTYTSMEAEFHALVEALRIASQASQSNEYCEVYVDVEPLTDKMREPDDNSEDWRDYRRSFHWLANKFDEWELEHIPREHNEDAHKLAREALFEGREEA